MSSTAQATRYAPPQALAWKPAAVGIGSPDVLREASARLPEFKEPATWFLVATAFTAGDFLLHEIFPVTKGEKTAPFYYGNKWLWSIPSLLVGRLVSDYVVKGPPLVRALTIATIATSILQLRYLKGYSGEFNLAVFAMHEALLVPLSFLILGPSPVTGFYGAKGSAV